MQLEPDALLDRLLQVAAATAREAGELIRSRASAPRTVRTKSNPVDLVTDTDRAADRLITDHLRAAFPTHGILSEEGGADPAASGGPAPHSEAPPGASAQAEPGIVWIVDPLDGTTNFAHGVPHFAVSIAAVAGLDPAAPRRAAPGGTVRTLAGVVYDPMRDELFTATARGPAQRNGEALAVSATASLDAALLSTGFPYDRRERPDFYLRYWREMMLRSRDVRRLGAAALDLAWVACGRLDGFWEWHLHPWDVTAGALLVRRAGGRVSDFSGGETACEAQQMLATNARVHDEMLAVLRSLEPRDGREPER